MKQNKIAKQIEWLGSYYRITEYHPANVIRLEELRKIGWFIKSSEWQTVYFGHIDVLRECVDFFESNKTPVESPHKGRQETKI